MIFFSPLEYTDKLLLACYNDPSGTDDMKDREIQDSLSETSSTSRWILNTCSYCNKAKQFVWRRKDFVLLPFRLDTFRNVKPKLLNVNDLRYFCFCFYRDAR